MEKKTIKLIQENISEQISLWDDITIHPHKFGGIEFQLNGKEIGHIHNFGTMDILFGNKLREILVTEGVAKPHHIFPQTGWVSYYFENETEIKNALWLLRLSYLLNSLKQNVITNEQFESRIESLSVSSSIKEIVIRKGS
jgi:Family of unknown function (DUF5519)